MDGLGGGARTSVEQYSGQPDLASGSTDLAAGHASSLYFPAHPTLSIPPSESLSLCARTPGREGRASPERGWN